MDNNFRGSIRCINLITRDDRYESAKNLFNSINLNVDFYRTEKNTNPVLGCFESHQNIIKESIKNNEPYTLIFEDDIDLSPSFTTENLHRALSLIENLPQNWNIYFLGCCPDIKHSYTYKTDIKNIYKVNAFCTHAYIISNKCMKDIAELEFSNKAIDAVYHDIEHTYAYLPSLFVQGLMGSDIGSDIGSKIIFRTWAMQMGEMYAMNVGTPMSNYYGIGILILVLVIILIIFIILIVFFN